MSTLRPLLHQVCRVCHVCYASAGCSDEAIADALAATAGNNPESWFKDEHLRAACSVLVRPS